LESKIVTIKKTNTETEAFHYDENGNLTNKSHLKITKKNGKTAKVVYTEFGSTTTFSNAYDKAGNRVSCELEKDSEKNKVEIFDRERYEYLAFDSHKNWTKRLTYKDDDTEPKYLTVREVEYY